MLIAKPTLFGRTGEFYMRRALSSLTWLGVAGVLVVYATKWKVVMKRIPYIRGQFEDEPQVEEEVD